MNSSFRESKGGTSAPSQSKGGQVHATPLVHFPGGAREAKKQRPACPRLCALPRRAGCSTTLACAMAAGPRLCGWLDSRQVAWSRCTLPMAPRTQWAPRLSPCTPGPALHRHLSRNGSSWGCWRLIPQRIYHQGLQGADSPHASAKLQPFAAGLHAPARARLRMRATAISRQQLPGCVQDSPSAS